MNKVPLNDWRTVLHIIWSESYGIKLWITASLCATNLIKKYFWIWFMHRRNIKTISLWFYCVECWLMVTLCEYIRASFKCQKYFVGIFQSRFRHILPQLFGKNFSWKIDEKSVFSNCQSDVLNIKLFVDHEQRAVMSKRFTWSY